MAIFATHTSLYVGFAIFAMFFGGGNLSYPVAMAMTGKNLFFMAIGMILSDVVLPFASAFNSTYYTEKGDYFSRIGGKRLELLILTAIMLAVGPLGSMPRCITLSYSSMKFFHIPLELWQFNIIFCTLLLVIISKGRNIVDFIGKYLAPMLVLFILCFVIIAYNVNANMNIGDGNFLETFAYGFNKGYEINDLTLGVMFGGIAFRSLRSRLKQHNLEDQYSKIALMSCIAGIVIESITYFGFMYITRKFGQDVMPAHTEDILALIAKKLFGIHGGVLFLLIVLLSCITTLFGLTQVVSEFLNENFHIKESTGKAITIIASCAFAMIGFDAVVKFLGIIMLIISPLLVAITIGNITDTVILKQFQYKSNCAKFLFWGALMLIVITKLQLFHP